MQLRPPVPALTQVWPVTRNQGNQLTDSSSEDSGGAFSPGCDQQHICTCTATRLPSLGGAVPCSPACTGWGARVRAWVAGWWGLQPSLQPAYSGVF